MTTVTGGLAEIRGWLKNVDPFFDRMDAAVAARAGHIPRVYSSAIRVAIAQRGRGRLRVDGRSSLRRRV